VVHRLRFLFGRGGGGTVALLAQKSGVNVGSPPRPCENALI
jgi:hypothetical protein